MKKIEAHITPILPYQGEKGDIPAGVTTTIVALVNHLSETISDIETVHKIAATLRIEAAHVHEAKRLLVEGFSSLRAFCGLLDIITKDASGGSQGKTKLRLTPIQETVLLRHDAAGHRPQGPPSQDFHGRARRRHQVLADAPTRASLRSAWADVVWGLFYAGRLTELEPAVRQHIPTSGS